MHRPDRMVLGPAATPGDHLGPGGRVGPFRMRHVSICTPWPTPRRITSRHEVSRSRGVRMSGGRAPCPTPRLLLCHTRRQGSRRDGPGSRAACSRRGTGSLERCSSANRAPISIRAMGSPANLPGCSPPHIDAHAGAAIGGRGLSSTHAVWDMGVVSPPETPRAGATIWR
jgi:hypothetical protein